MNKKIVQTISINTEDLGKRLDLLLCATLDIARSQVQKMIGEGLVLVNAKVSKTGYEVSDGDRIDIISEDKPRVKLTPNILFENDDLLVVEKPSGITSAPASGEKEFTFSEILAEKYSLKPDEMLVHRLDKGTSGIMIFSKNLLAQDKLRAQFKNRQVEKEYTLLVHGLLEPLEGSIKLPIQRDASDGKKMSVSEMGRDAITDYKVVKYLKSSTLISAFPKTGRTHQIRVHFSMIGHPVVGDRKYGHNNDTIDRIFLHAQRISFTDLRTDHLLTFESPLPVELERYLEKA